MSEIATKKEFDHGDRAWTRDGVKVYVEAETTAGQYLVAPLLDIGAYDPEYGPPSEESGPYVLVDELFTEAPRQFVDAKIAEAKRELESVRDEVSKARQELYDAQAERRRLVDRLKDIPALQHIERMIEGKFRFVVVEKYSDPKAMTVEEAQKEDSRYSNDRRLITLKTGKDGVYWAINAWHDGSGSDFKVDFFETMEDAQREVASRISLKLDDAFASYVRDAEGRRRYASSVVSYAESLKAAGGKIADDIAAALAEAKGEDARQTIESNQKQAAVYQARIAAAQAEIAALDAGQAS